MRMAGAKLGAERQRFGFGGFRRDSERLPSRAADELTAVERPAQVGDAPRRLIGLLLTQSRYFYECDGVIRPFAVVLEHGGERPFVGAESCAAKARKHPFVNRFRAGICC